MPDTLTMTEREQTLDRAIASLWPHALRPCGPEADTLVTWLLEALEIDCALAAHWGLDTDHGTL